MSDEDLTTNGMDFSKSDFENLCRICLQVGVVKSLFADDEVPKLCQKINECASVQIEKGDGLPENICDYCICELNIAYEFKNQCQKADIKLRSVVQSIHNNNEIKNVTIKISPKIAPKLCDSVSEKSFLPTNSEEVKKQPIKRGRGKSIIPEDSEKRLKVETQSREATPVLATVKEEVEDEDKEKEKHKGRFKCGECEKTFVFLSRLQQHESSHLRTRPYKCCICNKSFSRKDTLNSHVQTHGEQKSFKCDKCVRHFTRRSSLKKHYYVHTNSKSYRCKYCSKTFGRLDTYNVHLKTHGGVKPFICKYCPKTFARSDVLMRHQKTHEKDRKYVCTICLKSYCREDVLRSHLKLHHINKS